MKYKVTCRQIKLSCRRYKLTKLHNLILNIDPKKFYQFINRAIKPRRTISYLLNDTEKAVTTDADISSLLNSIFANNYTSTENTADIPDLSNSLDHHDNSLFKLNVKFKDTLRVLYAVSSGSAGPDGLTGNMIKQMTPLSAKPLYIVFLQLMGQSKFPTQWKCARITPL